MGDTLNVTCLYDDMLMQRVLPALLLITFLPAAAFAQNAETRTQPLEEIRIQKKLLPYINPLSLIEEGREPLGIPPLEPSDPVSFPGNEILDRISRVYRTHASALLALAADDLVEAERLILEAIDGLQSLMEDYPDIRQGPRFTELYRSVVTEYRDFYGITEGTEAVEGEVFAIMEEIFSEEDDWLEERFELPGNLTFARTDVPLVQNQHVHRHLVYYTLRRPEVMDRWLERSERYFPMMRKIFAEEGVPEELVHLAMIESGLVPTARSWASAVGMWQFIRATGAVYGLEVNWWIDERRDPVKATRAAARHLRDLHNIWGDWHLALANYNISPRGLRRAIDRAGGVRDYWAAYPYLPRETRGYVPGFIAATMIAMNPEEFGFQKSYGAEPWEYEVVQVKGLMPLDRLAEAAGITTAELREYNPELLRWATPPGDSYPLKIPVNSREQFLAAYEQIPVEEFTQEVVMHTVRRGETLGHIARRYGTTVAALFGTNENLSTTIHPGQTIIVPVAGGSMERIAADRPSNSVTSTSSRSAPARAPQPANTTGVTYRVKSGDTVGHIAEWFNVRSDQIRSWNGISNLIRGGQALTIYVPSERADYYRKLDELSFEQKQELRRAQRQGENVYARFASVSSSESSSSGSGTVTYVVRRNDTLTHIARRNGVSVAELQRLNNLRGTRIYVGQELVIRK